MLEETLDPRPQSEPFARRLAEHAERAGLDRPVPAEWLRGWNDQASVWANLRTIEHWIVRAGAPHGSAGPRPVDHF
ncbi:MAG: hypothetical protein EHM60_06140 [Lysobacterales bacterium]|nr:MAG: hypothetical protein EHM60_06140 [Xanthomonadales bacterium]